MKLILILSLFLAGCATRGEVVSVKWIKASSLEDVRVLCSNQGQSLRQGHSVKGCQWYASGVCMVVSMDMDFDTTGHEVKHCFDGKWHK